MKNKTHRLGEVHATQQSDYYNSPGLHKLHRGYSKITFRLTSLFCLSLLSACVSIPDVYLVDRHTVMESEASGEWPELEQRFKKQSISKGPVNLKKEPNKRRRDTAFNMLNGEFPVSEASENQ